MPMATAEKPRSGVDRVAATGAATALVGCLLSSFVSLRPNRLVGGVPRSLLASAGVAGWLLLGLAAMALAAAIVPLGSRRGVALRVTGGGLFVALAWALGGAATGLLPTGGQFARVSIGAGAWLVLLGASVVRFSSGGRSGSLPAWASWAIDAATALGVVAAVPWGGLAELSIAQEYVVQSSTFWGAVLRHLTLSGTAVGLGAVIGVPLGVVAFRSPKVRRVALGVVGVIQTIPSLALLGLLVGPLAALRVASPVLARLGVAGIGPTPAVIALTLYALLPIVRDTFVGLAEVDPAAIDAGRGMGMSGAQLLLRVELPLALPLLIEGVRSAAVLVIGITAVTAFVGAGGLGELIFTGLGQVADDLVLLGALPVIVLAVLADVIMRGVARVSVSRGIRGGNA